MSVGDYLLLVGSTCATGTMYCADVVSLIPDVANWPPDRLIGQYADPSTGEVACLIRVTTDVEAPNVSHTLLVREGALPERAVGLVQVVSDGAVPWDRRDGKPPRRIPISAQLEWRDDKYLGHLDGAQVGMGITRRLHELARRRDELLEQGPGAPDPTANPLAIELGAEDREFIRMWGLHIDSHVMREKFDLLDVKAVGTWASRLRKILGEDVVPKRRKDGDWGKFHRRID